MALAKASTSAAAAAASTVLLLLFAFCFASSSITFVSSSPEAVSFRADDGVVAIADTEHFAETISRSRKASCVYFYLPQCPACKQTKTVLLAAANKLEVGIIYREKDKRERRRE